VREGEEVKNPGSPSPIPSHQGRGKESRAPIKGGGKKLGLPSREAVNVIEQEDKADERGFSR
jgi:hypothetical protein